MAIKVAHSHSRTVLQKEYNAQLLLWEHGAYKSAKKSDAGLLEL